MTTTRLTSSDLNSYHSAIRLQNQESETNNRKHGQRVCCRKRGRRDQADTLARWSLLISIIFIVVFSAIAWFASPKGVNQTYVLLSSTNRRGERSRLGTVSLTIIQCLAINPHPLRLELLAHVGYVHCESTTFETRFLTQILAITFLAQWHPLITPERNDLRAQYHNGPVKSPSF